MQALEPLRRIGQQIECDTECRILRVRIEFAFQNFLGLELDVCTRETDLDGGVHAAGIEIDPVDGDLAVAEDAFDPIHHLRIDLDSRSDAADLNSRRFPEEIRQCIDDAEDDRGDNNDIFPEWVTVHDLTSGMHGLIRAKTGGAVCLPVRVFRSCRWAAWKRRRLSGR